MNDMGLNKPVALLTNRKTTLKILNVPAKLGRNDNVVDVHFFHKSVSREHCLIECVSRRFTIKDLGSHVGTFVNGVQLEPGIQYYIEDGDKVTIGQVKFVFHADYEELGRREQQAVRTGNQPMGMPQNMQPAGQQSMPHMNSQPERQPGMQYDRQPMGMPQRDMYPDGKPMGMPQQGGFIPEEDVRIQYYGGGNIPQQNTGRPSAGSIFKGPDGRKRAIVSARPLVQFEYDENEVLHIDTGLSKEPKRQRYTQDIQREEIEKAVMEAESAAVKEAEDHVIPEPAVGVKPEAYMPEEYVPEVKPEELVPEEYVPEYIPDEATAVEFIPEPDEVFEDEPTAVIPDLAPAHRGPVLVLKWRDEDTGETGDLTVDHFPFYIGRKSSDNDFAILKRGLSRRHFGFVEKDGAVFVFDDNSTNGVMVNEARIEPGHDIRLMKRDIIEAGNIKFAVMEV